MDRILALLAATICAACSIQPTVMAENFFTYEYEVSDDVETRIRANAAKICGQRHRIAVQTEYACLLPRCTKTYQCMIEAEAREAGLLAPSR